MLLRSYTLAFFQSTKGVVISSKAVNVAPNLDTHWMHINVMFYCVYRNLFGDHLFHFIGYHVWVGDQTNELPTHWHKLRANLSQLCKVRSENVTSFYKDLHKIKLLCHRHRYEITEQGGCEKTTPSQVVILQPAYYWAEAAVGHDRADV